MYVLMYGNGLGIKLRCENSFRLDCVIVSANQDHLD